MSSQQESDDWAEDFASSHARFACLFARREPQEQSKQYLRGLLTQVARKNSWQMAEAVGDELPDKMQRLLYRAQWDADAARDVMQDYVVEVFDDPEGIVVIDERGFRKKGHRSAGVKRQYSGAAGKVENCQISTFLTYASRQGHVFLDRQLYLPKEWYTDKQRREAACIPKEVVFQTKPQQAVTMLQHALNRGVPMRWVRADEVYGDAPYLRQAISMARLWYVMAVSVTATVWQQLPAVEQYTVETTGEQRVRLAEGAPPPTAVGGLTGHWSQEYWQRLCVLDGEKGPRQYDWGYERVVENREGLPGDDVWLVARRSVHSPDEVAYYLSNAPAQIPLSELARVALMRYTVEQCFQEAKGETGLDQYEVRFWHSWYRHITLSMMAHTWLAAVRLRTEKGGPPKLNLLR